MGTTVQPQRDWTRTLWKVVGGLGSAFLWMWTLFKWIADWTGRGLAVRDGPQFYDGLLQWLAGTTTPAWAPGLMALVLTAALIWKILSDKRALATTVEGAAPSAAQATDREALNVLIKKALVSMPALHADGGKPFLEFLDAMRQAAADGSLRFWGRARSYDSEELLRRQPLVPIAITHWHTFSIDPFSVCTIAPVIEARVDNFESRTQILHRERERETFVDLHVARADAAAFLRARGGE